MCKLCDKIYHCTESVPELEDGIQIDPEGVVQLITVHYNLHSDDFDHVSFSINFCPECGRQVNNLIDQKTLDTSNQFDMITLS